MNKREFDRALFNVIKAFEGNHHNYDSMMDNLSVSCTDEQWEHVVNTLDMISDSNFIKGELSPEIVIPNDYCDWGNGGVQE